MPKEIDLNTNLKPGDFIVHPGTHPVWVVEKVEDDGVWIYDGHSSTCLPKEHFYVKHARVLTGKEIVDLIVKIKTVYPNLNPWLADVVFSK